MTVFELGIDEAGRGPVLGPMVMAGVLVSSDRSHLLADWGVTDSKKYGSQKKGRQKRSDLAKKISDNFDTEIVVLSPKIIDHYVTQSSINRLEQETALKIINRFNPDQTLLDGLNLFKPLISKTIKAVDRADRIYLSVAAASIIAKDKRDYIFNRLCEDFVAEFGEISGGGYANNPTLEFVRWHLRSKGRLPDFYRNSYKWKALNSA